MPKIFITGSNETKGFVTGSGYISNPARVLLRERDDKLGQYPTLKRLGTKDRLGDISSSPFRDNSQLLDKIIQDSFDYEVKNFLTAPRAVASSSKWVTSGTEKIRKDLTASSLSGETIGSFTFEGGGDGEGRWLQTKSKVLNPTLRFEVYQGPYDLAALGLGLSQGQPTDVLKVQTSTDGSTWSNVFINSHNVSNQQFLDTTSGHLRPFVDFESALLQGTQNNPALIGFSHNNPKTRPSCIVNLSLKEFSNHRGDSFYIRIIQDSISSSNKKTWAIGYIEITSRDQYLTYPTLTSNSKEGQKLASSSISSPNYLNSNIQAYASPVGGDIKYNEEIIERISAFKDDTSFTNFNFFDKGVDADIYPGFSSRLLSKTKIEVDLSTTEKTDLGLLYKDTTGGNAAKQEITGSGGLESNLMVYWNKDLKRWEKIGWPIGVNDYGADTTGDNIINILSASAIGFSSVGVIASGSKNASTLPDETAQLLPNSILNSYNRPTDTFGFPFSSRYHATGSQYILAKDIGITKPFLLEKASLKFEMASKLNNGRGGVNDFLYLQNVYYTESTAGSTILHMTPTFFMLNQKKSKYTNVSLEVYTGSKETDVLRYSESLPRLVQLQSSSADMTYVEDTRELITYGQHTFVVSNSSGVDASTRISFDDFINTPIVRDGLTIKEDTFFPAVFPTVFSSFITGSFEVNFPCRNTAKITPFSPYYVCQSPGTAMGAPSGGVYGKYANIRMGKQLTGRSNGIISEESRALFNGYSAFKPSDDVISIQYSDVPESIGTGFFTNPVTVAADDGVDLISPYIIFPEDKLIFGWQAPLNLRRVSADIEYSYMTLFGNSKLTLYGSQIKDEKEIHDGLNQNLTSNNIFEVIGNDLVTDQFQIATRPELTGSVRERFTFGGYLPGTTNWASFGNNIITFEERIKAPLQSNFLTINNPTNRIGSEAKSIIRDAEIYETQSLGAIQVFSNCINTNRVYSDATDKTGDYLEGSTYGTSQSYFVYYVPGSSFINNARTTGSPTYNFNTGHFGFYSDLYQQAKDSKFKTRSTQRVVSEDKESAVKIQFVRGERSESGLDIREFIRIRPNEINGTAQEQYQSSNISLFATSSLPFFDDGIVRNRSYQDEAAIIVE